MDADLDPRGEDSMLSRRMTLNLGWMLQLGLVRFYSRHESSTAPADVVLKGAAVGSLTVAGRLALMGADGLAQHAVGDVIQVRQLRTGLVQGVEEAGRLLLGDGQRRLVAEHARVGARHVGVYALPL